MITYNKDTIKELLLEGFDFSVDYDSPIGKEFVGTIYNGERVLLSQYPAILTTRVFVVRERRAAKERTGHVQKNPRKAERSQTKRGLNQTGAAL